VFCSFKIFADTLLTLHTFLSSWMSI